MNSTWLPMLFAVASAPVESAGMTAGARLALAAGLLVLALALLLLEFFIVSGGLIAIGSLVAGIAAIVIAFTVNDGTGWGFAVGTPILAVMVARWGLRTLMHSRMVTQAESDGNAGYRHVTDQLGIGVGSTGVLVTNAFPTGRARFANGEVDVVVRGSVLAAGDAVVVKSIEGPSVIVAAAPPSVTN